MPFDSIVVRGAREHNLKNIDVTIPRDRLVVITGLSGSGKSSLAFDTIYAEGQRRYVESLSAYARQFLGQMQKPDVDYIEGLSPAISIDQKSASHNPRSTVATVTEIYDYLRLLFARVGTPHCPKCNRPIARQTVQEIVDALQRLRPGTRLMVLAPVVRDRKGEHTALFEDLRRGGYVRVRVDKRILDLAEAIVLDKNRRHTVEVVVDRIALSEGGDEDEAQRQRSRLTDSVETALRLGAGIVLAAIVDGEEMLFSEHFACARCGISLGEIAPRNFSFNSPHGACPACTGLGTKLEIDPEMVIPNASLSLAEGAIQPWARASATSAWYYRLLEAVAAHSGFSVHTPVRDLPRDSLDIVLFGTRGVPVPVHFQGQHNHSREYASNFEGVIPNLERRFRETDSDYVRGEIERYMTSKPCPDCKGKRLKPESLAVTVDQMSIADLSAKSVAHALEWVIYVGGEALRQGRRDERWTSADDLPSPPVPRGDEGASSLATRIRFSETDSPVFGARDLTIAYQVLKEVRARLSFLVDVGLDYLTLDRASATLSGGEAQRIRLATQIGSGLMGVLYVCDEPSIGLHPVDDQRLIATLKRLRDLGNTILIVEHDEAMMRAADHIIDLGPGAGEQGGHVVATGTPAEIMASPASLTGQYLAGVKQIPVPPARRAGNGQALVIRGARENNLQNIDVRIPLGLMVAITGVSGSGKSSLINQILYRRLAQVLFRARERPGDCDAIDGIEHIDKVVDIDQSPIGRTPRSNPATYTGTFTPIRELFSQVPEARMRGYGPGRFSFNVKGGRCEACSGEGYVAIEMHFLPDITVPCEVCKGKRYNREALEIRFRERNIAEVLELTVAEARRFFEHFPAVRAKLQTLEDVGLGYIRLGQPAPTPSGGEAQRVKVAPELSRRSTGRTLYLLDEPTTGLAFEDCAVLLRVLQRLVDAGNTVVLIEHHLDLIKNADYVIDLGPGGGQRGGHVVATGTPEQVSQVDASQTGVFLRRVLAPRSLAAVSGL